MLEALVETATRWMAVGLPLETFKIVLFEGHRPDYLDRMAAIFRSVARTQPPRPAKPNPVAPGYDLFTASARPQPPMISGSLTAKRGLGRCATLWSG